MPSESDDEPDRNDLEYIKRVLRLPALNHTFASFKKVSGSELSLSAFWAMAEGDNKKPLLFCYGGYGNGKTHLVEAVVIRLYERGLLCPYYNFEDVTQRIKKGMRPESIYSADDIVQSFCTRKMLLIDDYGLGTDTKWATGRLETIIDYRYRYRLWTILTTNKDLTELEELSGRILSRFYDPDVSLMVINEATDYRRRRNL